ncbi:complement component 1 Q subcomponent-binding protein, mitochondrial [Strigomonas culicis]|uniref:Complement component 1 Q subcomponent-binding protein, mitochondrial n=1 Tax=Strigomonas culicis TaxID=28005 RepID=S9U1D1_9TRYP|nr:complement component 1 Q subcomponent-binding protein, mitochondrial [Strigomonas culicis]|eukprot:EPY24552.1 complement component 1 Q subcomponent-binding protein, mitochondrial [Strigomonas culicis]
MRRTIASFAFPALRRAVAAACVAAPRLTLPAAVAPVQKRFAHDGALEAATRRELEEEQSRQHEVKQPTPPAGWTVARAPGKCTFELNKQYEDEAIKVFYCPKEDTDDVDAHNIIVFITSKAQTLQVDLTVEEGELVLDNIAFYTDSSLALNETAEADAQRKELYPGPNVSELDEALVDSFVKYLEKRGIDEDLGEFITLYSFWAEQQEYEAWLSKINKFVA